MIHESFLHCRGIGPTRLTRLQQAGIRSWRDVLERPDAVPRGLRKSLVEECRSCVDALEKRDIPFFVERLSAADRWRILAEFFEDASYFDIETSGLDYDASITTIVCWHRGQLHTFVEHENLDEFLQLLDEVRLLVSFNGASFDVPRVLDAFHIPQLPCPHVDLRWLCHHQGLRGGLKEIARQVGIHRPRDLQFADGEMAVIWWSRWIHFQDRRARDLLVRYCAADVVMSLLLARRICQRQLVSQESGDSELWSQLPGDLLATSAPPSPQPPSPQPPSPQSPSPQPPARPTPRLTLETSSSVVPDPSGEVASAAPFGSASPARLRARVHTRPA